METRQLSRRSALTIGVAGVFLIAAAQGAAMAGHGYTMEQHPHSGDPAPTANEAAASADTNDEADAQDPTEAWPGDLKREDFPRPVAIDRDRTEAQ